MSDGEVVEWLMALVLKTSMSARASWVRIPPSPFYLQHEGPLTTISRAIAFYTYLISLMQQNEDARIMYKREKQLKIS